LGSTISNQFSEFILLCVARTHLRWSGCVTRDINNGCDFYFGPELLVKPYTEYNFSLKWTKTRRDNWTVCS